MKFTVNKHAILMSEAEEAKEMATDRQWMLDKCVLLESASIVLSKYHGEHVTADELIRIEKAEICKNHYQIRPWVSILVKYWHRGGDWYAVIGMDLVETYEMRNGEAFVQIWKPYESTCI